MTSLKLTKEYQHYPKYKDSGVEWIGEIPVGWDFLKFKSKFAVSDERVEDDLSVDQILSVSGYRGIEPKDISSNEGQMPSDDISQYRVVRPGQLVVNTMWLNYTGLGVSKYTGFVSPAYRAYVVDESMDPEFVHYLMRSIPYVQKYSSLLYGIRPNSLQVKPMDFERIEILVPSKDEQKIIAAYLDEKTALIDAIIEKKKKQLSLLSEKRAAIINRAVTKGLNANAKLVDSGIEWIGKIPEGWEVKKLKHVAHVEGGYAFSSDSYANDSLSGVLLVRITEVKEQIAEEGRRYVPAELWDTLKNFRVQKDDILIALTGYVGDTSVFPLDEKALLNQRAGKIQSLGNIHPMYLYYCTKPSAFRTFLSLRSKSSAQENVSNYDVGEYSLPLPPHSEQQKIAQFLNEQCGEYQHAQDLLEQSITLLQEFKSALISHVVTGKVKI